MKKDLDNKMLKMLVKKTVVQCHHKSMKQVTTISTT